MSGSPGESSDRIHLGICGAGTMGAGIAEAFLLAGHSVSQFDVDGKALERSRKTVGRNLARLVEKGLLEAGADAAALARLTGTQDLAELSDSQLVIEAVIEDLEVKQQLFRQLEDIVGHDTVLVTNTSTLSVTEIASALGDPERVAGAHFFNPASRMKLVEVTPGLATRSEVVNQLRAWLEAIGKTPVLVQESPGGIVSRLQLLVRNEAVRLVAEGVATAADVDTAMKIGSGWPMGPLELIDLVGVDVHVRNSESLAREMGSNRYQPDPFLRRLVRGGRLGRKSGRGIFDYGTDKANDAGSSSSPRGGASTPAGTP